MRRKPSDPEGALRQIEGIIDRFRSMIIGIMRQKIRDGQSKRLCRDLQSRVHSGIMPWRGRFAVTAYRSPTKKPALSKCWLDLVEPSGDGLEVCIVGILAWMMIIPRAYPYSTIWPFNLAAMAGLIRANFAVFLKLVPAASNTLALSILAGSVGGRPRRTPESRTR